MLWLPLAHSEIRQASGKLRRLICCSLVSGGDAGRSVGRPVRPIGSSSSSSPKVAFLAVTATTKRCKLIANGGTNVRCSVRRCKNRRTIGWPGVVEEAP